MSAGSSAIVPSMQYDFTFVNLHTLLEGFYIKFLTH